MQTGTRRGRTHTAQLLIVEPDIDIRMRMQGALASAKRCFWFAGSCAEALALSQRTPPPEIAIVAAELPDGCGVDLLMELQRLAVSCQCVTTTIRPSVEAATRAMQLGAIDYLAKPIHDMRVLSNAVEWALARSEYERQKRRTSRREDTGEQRYQLAVAASQDGLWDWDLTANSLFLSQRWKQIVGCENEDLDITPETWWSRVHPDDLSEVHSTVTRYANGCAGHFELDYRMRSASGDYIWVRTRGISVSGPNNKTVRIAGTMSDISRTKAVEERLVHEALHDGLTRLSNRVAFHQKLQEAFARQGSSQSKWSFAVLFIDLDHFKKVNDSLGHPAGDQLLREISRRLQAATRVADSLARLGGDEFAILLSGMTCMQDVEPILRRIETTLRAPCVIQGYQVVPSASIGIAFGSEHCGGPEEILRNADIAMYRAKEQGRSRAEVFGEEMHKSALGRFRLEEDLRHALETHELELHYQPIFEIKTSTLQGFEALARWQHADRGWISPANFIPVAEECGLIIPLGRWVLQTACQQLAIWQRTTGATLTMSVNLSPKQVFDPDIVPIISNALRTSGIAPATLKLEITEGVFMGSMEMASFILEQVKTLGVELSLDDFGTGYSSLTYLNRLPFDLLKIDRSFVESLAEDGLSLVQAIITMAQALDIQVVAEGIESPTQLEALRKMGCEYGQGFFFAGALSGGDATGLVHKAAGLR